MRAQLQVAETEYSMLTRAQAEHWQLKVRRTYDNWLRDNPVDASSLTTVCSTKAGAEGGSSDKVCGIDSASSLADVCNTNENAAGDGQGQRGRGDIGRPSSATTRTRFDDSDKEAFETPADSGESSAHSDAEAAVCRSMKRAIETAMKRAIETAFEKCAIETAFEKRLQAAYQLPC